MPPNAKKSKNAPAKLAVKPRAKRDVSSTESSNSNEVDDDERADLLPINTVRPSGRRNVKGGQMLLNLRKIQLGSLAKETIELLQALYKEGYFPTKTVMAARLNSNRVTVDRLLGLDAAKQITGGKPEGR